MPEPGPGQVQAWSGPGPPRSRLGLGRSRADFYQQKINNKLKSLGHFGDVRGGVEGVFLSTFGALLVENLPVRRSTREVFFHLWGGSESEWGGGSGKKMKIWGRVACDS